MKMKLKSVLVIGAGTMGRGIAQWFAQASVQVYLTDSIAEVASSSLNKIFEGWDKLQLKGKFSQNDVSNYKQNIQTVDFRSLPSSPDLIVEAIIEDLEIKKALFERLDKEIDTDCVFASNTSGFTITSMTSNLEISRQKRFLGLHFFNPATIMKLVEIIATENTDPQLVKDLYQWFESKAKKPALCKDGPGFIVNRSVRNFYGEALRIASFKDESKLREIDRVCRNVGGFPMGPFELMDFIGIDINYKVTCKIWEEYLHHPRLSPHPLQKTLVDNNKLGKKTKAGFYHYEE